MLVLYSVASSERGDHLKLQTVITNILPPKNTSVTIDLFHVVRYCFLNNTLSLYGSYDCT